MTVAHKPLGARAQAVLRYMQENGGISRRDGLRLGILNVPARILDIRTAYGADSILTDMVSVDGSEEFAVYRFTGAIVEADLFGHSHSEG